MNLIVYWSRLDQDTNLNRRGNSRIPFSSKSNNQFSSLFNLNQNGNFIFYLQKNFIFHYLKTYLDSSRLSSVNNRSRFYSSHQSNQNTHSFQKWPSHSSEKYISPEPIPTRRTTVEKNPSYISRKIFFLFVS